MGSEAIIHKIEEKARLAVEEIHLEGSRKVGEAKAKILAAAQENAKKIKDRVEDEKLDITRREQRKASMQIRQNTLGAKRRVIDRAFESATEKLCELEGEEWEALMTLSLIHISRQQSHFRISDCAAAVIVRMQGDDYVFPVL